jgi:hypothetical protein
MPSRAERLAAAQTVVDVQMRYARLGQGMAQAALAGARIVEPLRHYPSSDVVDAEHACEFYYHAHTSSRYPVEEHGHFHLFVRPDGGGFHHLAGLSLDDRGWPLRWFVTNRWVTGEQWADAHTCIAALPTFRPVTQGRLAPVAQWLGAMVVLYSDVLASLLRRRDTLVARRLATTSAEALFEDRRLDVITETRVSLPRRLQQLAH